MRCCWGSSQPPSGMITGVDHDSGASRPGQMTRRLGATTLLAQALSVFFGGLVAWQLDSAAGGERGMTLLWVIGAVAVLCVLAAGALRTRAGIWLGWLCQVLTLASAFLLPAMAVVGLLFALLWWLCLKHGTRIDQDKARWAAEADPAAYPDPTPDPTTAEER